MDTVPTNEKIESDIEELNKAIKEVLPKVRNEVERMSSYNQDLHQLFNERLGGIKQDLEGLRERDIKGLATQNALSEVNTKVERRRDLPTMEQIVRNLTAQHSPLATKNQLVEIQKDVVWLKGVMSVQLLEVFGGVVLIIGMWFNLSSMITKNTQTLPSTYQQPVPSTKPTTTP